MPITTRRCLLAALACLIAAPAAAADDFPGKRPITLVVGFPAGGSADLIARTLADPLAKKLGATIVIAGLFNPAVKYDGQTDFTPIGAIGGSTPQAPALARTVSDEVKRVRAVAPASMKSSS